MRYFHLHVLAISLFCGGCIAGYQTNPTFVTDTDVSVFVNEARLAEISESDVNEWTYYTIGEWYNYGPSWWEECLDEVQKNGVGISVRFIEECPITINAWDENQNKVVSMKVKGYTTGGLNIVIANCGSDRETYIHELSHVLVWQCAGIWEEAHNFFKSVDFPY